MDPIRICISGVTGWVGKELAGAITGSTDLVVVSAVSRKHSGENLGKTLNLSGSNVIISGSVKEAIESHPDVMIDYTSPDVVKKNVLTAIENGVHVVVGTSGLTDQDYEEIDALARNKKVGVIAAGNFAVSAALMLHFATIAARFMPGWEILDFASDTKVDSPSGTANELAYRLSSVKKQVLSVPLEKMHGPRESRGLALNGTQVHSLRLPGYVIGADVVFGGEAEKLTLRFEAGNEARTYVEGTLLAARKVSGFVGLIRGLDNLLDL